MKASNLINALIISCIANASMAADLSKSTSQTKISSSSSLKVNQAFLNDVKAQAKIKGKLSDSQISALLSNLSSMNYTQIDGLVKGPASHLSNLIGSSQGSAVSSSANSASQQAVSQQGVNASAGSNNAMASSINTQMTSKGGIVSNKGAQVSACEGQACEVSAGGNANDTEAKTGKGKNGEETYQYPDGSVRIHYPNGSDEVVDKKGDTYTKNAGDGFYRKSTPNPEGHSSSGVITLNDVKGVEARKGSKGGPIDGNTSTGAGGTTTSRTTAAGTPIEIQTQTVVDLVQVREVIRIAAEKFGGPVVK